MSKYLIEQYQKLHQNKGYGASSIKLYDDIFPWVRELNPLSIMDFGCGQSKLIDKLQVPKKYRYDPAIEKYSKFPSVANDIELVICNDVLEHIPENEIEQILRTMRMFTDKAIFSIGLQPAKHFLPDRSNAHCTVQSVDWWINKIEPIFQKIGYIKNIRGVKFLCRTW